ncbi:DASH complex subunit Duo1-domain-containing protein [Scheffersomyces amazonensis]|uniref:DASH complex subunit Duo1-domain-containing protein n=1 Tax=Scheffersomyces amazonensis TaxID=1078765 RepID=UPI00315C9BB4
MSDHISNPPSSSSRSQSTSSTTNRQLALERELAQLNRINSTMANLIQTIKFTNGNIAKLNDASGSTHVLLDQWIRILSQTNFTHDVINDKVWKGNRIGDNEEEEIGEGEDESDDYEEKIELEQQLLREYESLEAENEQLTKRIESRDNDRSSQHHRDSEAVNKRRRELGLTGSRGLVPKRIRSGYR